MKYDVCIIGGCSIDLMYYEKEDNSYNKKPDIIVPGGKASNQAVAASRAGAKTTIITIVGNDKIGNYIIDNLKNNNVSVDNIELINNVDNDYNEIYIDLETKDNEIVRKSKLIDSFSKEIIDKYTDTILNSKLIVTQLKIPIEITKYIVDICNKNNKSILLTPCTPNKLMGNEDILDKVTYITCNKEECQRIFNSNNIEECISKYPNKLIVTLGPKGVIYHDGTSIVELPAILSDNLKDTTGAGDTFNGNLAYCITHNYTLKDAIIRSQYASSMKVQVSTAQAGMPSREELNEYVEKIESE